MNNSILKRRIKEIIDRSSLAARLKSGKSLRIKLGIDPTGKDLHLGHAILLWKLREFQELGHTAILIVGDWTAQIGDPSGKNETRPPLTLKQTRENSKSYLAQAFKVLIKQKTEVHYNSEWFKHLDFEDMFKLLSQTSVAQLIAHETFRNRLKNNQPFFAHELLYPLMQAYDSVSVKSDVELGGLDQKFNLLMGRKLQKIYNQTPQDAVMVEYLAGSDGRIMGKSLNNYIALTDEPEEMFGKVMSISDQLIGKYFELCTNVPENEIAEIAASIKNKSVNPRELKVRLGREIVMIYHGKIKAEKAVVEFEKKFGKSKGQIKADYELRATGGHALNSFLAVLVRGKLAQSKSEARRKMDEGAVWINGEKLSVRPDSIKLSKGDIVRLGKRFLRIK